MFLKTVNVCSTKTPLTLFMLEFFSEKIKRLYLQHDGNGKKIPFNNLPYYLKRLFPEMVVLDVNGKELQEVENLHWRHILLPNMVIIQYGLQGAGTFLSLYEDSQYNVLNSLGFIKELHDNMPLWKTEFTEVCETYKSDLQKIGKDRAVAIAKHNPNRLIPIYIQDRVNDLSLMEIRTPDFAERMLKRILTATHKQIDLSSQDFHVHYNLTNLQMEFYKRNYWPFIDASGFYNGDKINFRERDISLEKLQDIDRQLPIWTEEAMSILFDIKKKEKSDQINRNVMRALVKQKMKELKIEYQLDDDTQNGNMILGMKLEKRRMLKVTLRAGHTDWIKRQLDSLEEIVKALNAIPMDFRIYFQKNNARWEKETDE